MRKVWISLWMIFVVFSIFMINCKKSKTLSHADVKENDSKNQLTMRPVVTYTQPLYVCKCCQLLLDANGEWSCPEPYVDCARVTPSPCAAKVASNDTINFDSFNMIIKELEQSILLGNTKEFFQSKEKREILFPELKTDFKSTNYLLNGMFKVRKFINNEEVIYTIYDPNELKSIYSLCVSKQFID